MISLALIQASAPAGVATWLGNPVVPMLVILVLAYFLLFRPVQQQRREQDSMRAGLKPGDAIVTSGGIHATVTRVDDDKLQVRIANGVNVDLAKSAVSSLLPNRKE